MKAPVPFLGVFLSMLLLTASCKKERSCENCPPDDTTDVPANLPPVARAGADQGTVLPQDSVLLDGSASTDADGRITNYAWTKVSGPDSFQLVHADSAKTMVRTLGLGVYQFELTVQDDKGAQGKDTVQVTVSSGASTNQPPVARAGDDQTLTLPTGNTVLDGSASYDPDGRIVVWQWAKIEGPTAFTVAHPADSTTEVTGLVQGVYRFVLVVTDNGGLQAKDTVQVTVEAASSNTCDISSRPQVNAWLTAVGQLSQLRYEMAVAATSHKIVFAGGYSASWQSSSRVDIYDIATSSWSTAELSQARFNIATAVLGNKIYFAGGDIGDNNWRTSDRVDIYDAVANTWTTATLSQPRTLMVGVAAGNKVLFAGGSRGGHGSSGESLRVDIYNATTNAWTSDSLAYRGSGDGLGMSATVVGSKIYLAGGAGDWFAWDFGGVYSSTINVYDAATGAWTALRLSEERGGMGAIAVFNKNYWAGGRNWQYNQVHVPTNLVEIMDMATGLSTFDCLFQPNNQPTAVQKDARIVFFTPHTTQGVLDQGSVTNKFDIFDPSANRWSIGVLPLNIYNASVVSVNNTIYVAGGIVNGALSNKVWRLEF